MYNISHAQIELNLRQAVQEGYAQDYQNALREWGNYIAAHPGGDRDPTAIALSAKTDAARYAAAQTMFELNSLRRSRTTSEKTAVLSGAAALTTCLAAAEKAAKVPAE